MLPEEAMENTRRIRRNSVSKPILPSEEYDNAQQRVEPPSTKCFRGPSEELMIENEDGKRLGINPGYFYLYVDDNGFLRAKLPGSSSQETNREGRTPEKTNKDETVRINCSESRNMDKTQIEGVEQCHRKDPVQSSAVQSSNVRDIETSEGRTQYASPENRPFYSDPINSENNRNVTKPKQNSENSSSDNNIDELNGNERIQENISIDSNSVNYPSSYGAYLHTSSMETPDESKHKFSNTGSDDEEGICANRDDQFSSASFAEYEPYEDVIIEEERKPKHMQKGMSWTKKSWRTISRSLSGRKRTANENDDNEDTKTVHSANHDAKTRDLEGFKNKRGVGEVFRNLFGGFRYRGGTRANKRENRRNEMNEIQREENEVETKRKTNNEMNAERNEKEQREMKTETKKKPRSTRRNRNIIVTYPNPVVSSIQEHSPDDQAQGTVRNE